MLESLGGHIYLVSDEPLYDNGWYFSDETEQLQGPFGTKEEAEKNLKSYTAWLDKGGPHEGF